MGNLIDNIVGYFNPQAGFEREKARAATEMIRKYDGAANSRRTKGWDAKSTSANVEIKNALNNLRDRSRDMVRNNSYAKAAIDVITTNTIGTGIRPAIKSENELIKKQYSQEWNKWADSKLCDFDGIRDFYGIQEIVMRCITESGECLIIRKPTKDKKNVPLEIQVLEADYLDTTKDKDGTIIQGVEFDIKGKRKGYWLFNQNPNDNATIGLKSEFVDAKNVIHIFKVERAGQVRGVPWGSSALLLLKDLADYQDAELVRQKIAACFTVFVQDSGVQDNLSGTLTESEMSERVEPGIIEHLPAGKTVTFAQPPVTTGYGEYTKNILRAVATAYGVTYESITGDLSTVNFSSGRMGWLEFHRRITNWQYNLIIPQLCDTVWKWFVEAGQYSNLLPKENVSIEWTAPKREMIDPVKEINGINLAIRSGLVSWSESVRAQGYDPNEVAKEMSEDYKLFDTNGLKLDIDGRIVGKAGAGTATPS